MEGTRGEERREQGVDERKTRRKEQIRCKKEKYGKIAVERKRYNSHGGESASCCSFAQVPL